MMPMPMARRALARLTQRARGPELCVVALDFDGTLAPLAATPAQARMEPALRPILVRLSRQPGIRLAIISGRGMRDLRQKARVPRALYFSNHGLDCSLKGLGPSPRRKAAWRGLARRVIRRLRPLLRQMPGLRLEPKGLDATLHLRGLSPQAWSKVSMAVRRLLRGLPVTIRLGKLALELRPKDGWDKGRAIQELLRHWGRPAAFLYAGDDRTDEDAFKALHSLAGRLSVKIGPGPSAADMRIARPRLRRILGALLRAPNRGA